MRLMRLSVSTLVVALGLLPTRARADAGFSADFDDDFGIAPAPSKADPEPRADESEAAAPAAADSDREGSRELIHNTVTGLTGGVHAVSAGSGQAGSFRLALSLDFFRKDGFLVAGSQARQGITALSLSVTPIEHLELAAQTTVMGTENTAGTPQVVQVLGDAQLFAKGYLAPLPWLTVGGDFEVALLNAIGTIGYQANATGIGLRANATLDLRKLRKPFPLIVRTSLRYYFDNSAKLIRNVEAARYDSLSNPAQPDSEYRHLLTNVERFAYRINRIDALSLSFGFEFPFAPWKDVLLSPIAEWNVAVPVNRQDYDCLVTNAANDLDGCLAGEGFSARLSTFTLGLRAQPKLPGLGILLAVDVATSGSNNSVRELAANAPYSIYLGFSYAYELFVKRAPAPAPVKVVEVPVEKVLGHVQGLVIDKQGLQPIAHALVHFDGTKLSDIASDESGKFVSYPLEPGAHALLVSAVGYEAAACNVTLPDDHTDVQTRCELNALPKQGSLRGRVLDATGTPVSKAHVELSGPSTLTLESDSTGNFAIAELPAGEYGARVEAEGFLLQVVTLSVRDKTESAALLTLVPKPTKSLVTLTPKRIAIKQQVQFVAGSAEIAGASNALLSEVADVLLRNRDIAQVEVQGHTDNSGAEDANRELSERRAQAVREWLVKAGVAGDRLTAVGYGSSRPLAPNITASNRARNRRVELVILQMR